MRQFFFTLGVVLLIGAAASGVAQILALVAQQGYQPISIGSIWYGIHPNSLVGFQALVEKRLSPELWTPLQYVLVWPAWLTLAVPGLLLCVLCRPRRHAFA